MHTHDPKPMSQSEINRALETLIAGRLIAVKKARYFSAMLLSFVTRECHGLGTIGVTKNGIILWDPAMLIRVTPEQAGGLWLHECMHRLNKHAERMGGRDPKVWNMAGDLAINTAVLDMGAELPGGELMGLFPKTFGFQDGLTADEYYALLLQEAEKQQKAKEGDGEPGEGDEPKAGGGWCGSCAGRPVPNEPGEDDPENRTEAEMERTVRETAQAIKAAAQQGRGRIPQSLQRWADEAVKTPKVPWRQKLARITRNAVAWRTGSVDHRYDAPSRRQAGIGYGIGKPILPRLRCPVPRVVVVLDTSASMGHAELGIALTETKGVLNAVGADIEFCACDSSVHEMKPIQSINDAMRLVKGGGGTDFRPAFEACLARKPRPEIIVFATDGDGPAPDVCPPGVKVVWLLIGKYRRVPATWGEVVEIDTE